MLPPSLFLAAHVVCLVTIWEGWFFIEVKEDASGAVSSLGVVGGLDIHYFSCLYCFQYLIGIFGIFTLLHMYFYHCGVAWLAAK